MFNRFSLQYGALAALLASCAVASSSVVLNSSYMALTRWSLAILTGLELLIAAELFFLALVPVSCLHTPFSAFYHFCMNVSVYFIGWLFTCLLTKATKNVRTTQDAVLKQILGQNASTEFGKLFDFSNIKDRQEFRNKMKLTTYSDYESYIARIAKGEKNVLTTETVIKMCTSSGTTGKPKLIPFTNALMKIGAEMFLPMLYQTNRRLSFLTRFAPLKMLEIKFAIKWRHTECGLPIGFASTFTKTPTYLTIPYATPGNAQALMTEPAQMYVHLLFALLDRDIKAVTSMFGGPILVTFEFLQSNWQKLADDIRHGRVTNSHGIPPEIVTIIERHHAFKEDVRRADEIEAVCLKGFQGIAVRLWPRLRHVIGTVTGSHAVYADRLKYFLGPKVQIISPTYGASEGAFAAPLSVDQWSSQTFTLHIRGNFYEFIPESDIFNENPRVLFADELEAGKRYELVITTRSGFYRYRMGDVVGVVGFYNQAPVIEFRTRVGGIIDLIGEKTTEDMMSTALKGALRHWDGCRQIIDYTVTDSVTLTTSLDGDDKNSQNFELFYAIFVELDGVSRPLSSAEVDAFDESLATVHNDYKGKRAAKRIAKPKIFVVESGTFEKLQAKILEKTASASNQYKTPRYQKNPEYLQFLVENSYKL